MSQTAIERRLRRFQMMTAGSICIGVLIELLSIGHTANFFQWIPLVLATAGLITIGVALASPRRRTLQVLRFVMVLLIAGSALGLYKHLEDNIAFEKEIRPNSTTRQVLSPALRGVNPLLAPGILALAGALALGSTYRHPSLRDESV